MTFCPKCNTKLHGVYVPGGSSSTERTESAMVLTTAMKCYACGHYEWDDPVKVMPNIPPPGRNHTKPQGLRQINKRNEIIAIVNTHIGVIAELCSNGISWRGSSARLAAQGIKISASALREHFMEYEKEHAK